MLQALNTTETFDSFGQPIPQWTTIGVYSGEVAPLGGRELVAAKQVKAQAGVKITTRHLGQGVFFGPENRWVIGDRYGPMAAINTNSNSVTLSANAPIPLLSWVFFPYNQATNTGDSSLQVYQVTAGAGSNYTISPNYGGANTSATTISQARFFGLFDTVNVEERNRQYVAFAYEIQQGGKI